MAEGQVDILERIERQLAELVGADRKSWVQIYRLLDEVEREELYKAGYPSYTAWVNAIAERMQVHVSLLWMRKKAGRFYAEYEQRQQAKGQAVPSMEEISVSPDNFILVEKIAGKNDRVADELMDKVIAGDLKRSDLKNAWATVKADRADNNQQVTLRNGNDRKRGLEQEQEDAGRDEDSVAEQPEDEDSAVGKIKATDIMVALNHQRDWINVDAGQEGTRQINPYVMPKYKVLPEFPVETGTTRHARRVDAMVLETITAKAANELVLHGIEIKVSKGDLLNDDKMQEYTSFCDCFWLAVPAGLEPYVKQVALPEWGLLVVDKDGNIHVAWTAKHRPGACREESIRLALIKLM